MIKERNKIVEAIQVCFELTPDNQAREVNGLLEALTKFDLKEGLILTYSQEDDLSIEGKKIKAVPIWKWLAR